MAINNKRTLLSEKEAKQKELETRLRNKLKESYEESLTEADEDEDLSADEDEDIDIDDSDGLDLSSEDGEDIDLDDEGEEDLGIDADLTPDQSEFVDDEIDMLLEPEVEEMELDEADDFDFDDEEDDLDIESEADDLDLGLDDESGFEDEEDFDGPSIDDEELQGIIDSDDTYDELGDTLKGMAIEEFPGDEEDDFNEDDFSDEIDAEAEVEAELEEALMTEGFDASFDEDEVPMTESRRRAIKRKRSMKEDVKLQSELKSLDFDEESEPSEVKKGVYSKVSDTAKGGASKGKVIHGKGLSQSMKSQTMKKESIHKSKMLVKAAEKINSLQNQVKQLQLENYRLIKANGILSATGEKLDKSSRKAIAESFGKCKNKVQVDALYEKVVKTIKEKARPSLNETVTKARKTTVKTAGLLQENEQTERMSFDQQRKNMLMGLTTSDDVYFKFNS